MPALNVKITLCRHEIHFTMRNISCPLYRRKTSCRHEFHVGKRNHPLTGITIPNVSECIMYNILYTIYKVM